MVDEIFQCKDKSIEIFHQCRTISEQYQVFDELTYRLGDGYNPPKFQSPSSSSAVDWKVVGLRGLRPLVISFFNDLHTLARLRQTLSALTNDKSNDLRQNYSFIWNDEDIVHKVVHWFVIFSLSRRSLTWNCYT